MILSPRKILLELADIGDSIDFDTDNLFLSSVLKR